MLKRDCAKACSPSAPRLAAQFRLPVLLRRVRRCRMSSVAVKSVWLLVVFGISPASAANLFGDLLPRIDLPDACEIKCKNNDGDDLFPQGTINGTCVDACRDEHRVAPPSPGVRPSGNNRAFILLEPMTYMIGTSGVRITVPSGFVTDYASIPERLWSIYSPHDQYSRAAIVHDYLYWSQLCTRAQADNLLMIAMKESDVPEKTRQIVYSGVHLFGKASWIDNQEQRMAKLPKVVPLDRRDFPPNWSWEMYRQYLMQRGVNDPPFSGSEYCSLGNTDNVPGINSPSDRSQPRLAIRALRGVDSERLMNGPGSYK